MTTTNATSNGRLPRKSLGNQIDRLDGMLEGLSEALNESVADAVRGAVGQAVREAVVVAVREVLATPALLRAALAQHGPSEPEPWKQTPRPPEERAGGWWGWLCDTTTTTVTHSARNLNAAWQWVLASLRRTGGLAARYADQLAAGGLGLLALLLGLSGGSALGVAACGAGAAALALVPQGLKCWLSLSTA
jgi:hypothetical protein